MTGSQKIFLRIVGLVGDREDADKQPDRLLVSGRGRLVPTITLGTADVRRGPDDLHEITLVEPVAFNIVNGMLTYNGDPYVWLPVPTGQWVWRIEFEEVVVDGRLRELDGYSFPLTPATPAQMNDPAYPGVNIAQYSLGTWAPGTVNLTAEAIGQITIMLNQASSSAAGASDSAESAAESAAEALGYKNQMAADAGSAEDARDEAILARNASQAARTGAETARDEAQTAKSGAETARTGAETARDEAQTVKSGAETARDEAQTAKSGAETARTGAETARTGAETARDEAQGHASDAVSSAGAASRSASDAAGSASAAAGSASDAAGSASEASQSATDADTHRQAAEGHAGDAATASSGAEDARDLARQAQQGAEDERVVAQGAAVLAEGHAQAADGHRVDAEAAAALAQSLRWVVKGAWSPGSYEAGDVVVWDERAYYAQTATSAQPPAQPWVPLTPAGGGASHWDQLDGKPTSFPPEAHTHDAEDVSGAATPLLDVTEASVGAQSVGEALDATTDASRLEGALTDQVDASSAVVNVTEPGTYEVSPIPIEGIVALLVQGMLVDVPAQVTYLYENKSDVGHTHTWTQISDAPAYSKDTTGDNLVQRGSNGHINVPAGAGPLNAPRRSEVDAALTAKSDVGHTHPVSDVDGLQAALAGKADTSHTHTTAQVTGLDSALAGKADTSHTHTTAQVTGLDSALAGKADTSHTHSVSQVTGLDSALAGKADTSHTHTPASLGAVARSGTAATVWTGTAAEYAALAEATKNAAGFVAVISP